MVFWLDCETTGLECKQSSAIQYGCIIEVDGKVEEEFQLFCSPFDNCVIDDKALEVNKRTREEIATYSPERLIHADLKSRLSLYCSPYDKTQKFVIAGYNVPFDIGFLRAMWERQRDPYFGSWFFWPSIDVAGLVAHLLARDDKFRLVNYKLSTVCAHFGIKIDAHDALSDIRATRQLYYRLKEELK